MDEVNSRRNGDTPPSLAAGGLQAAGRRSSFVEAAAAHVTPGREPGRSEPRGSWARGCSSCHKRVKLTPAGQACLGEIRAAGSISEATDRVRKAPDAGPISVLAYPTFAIRWFIPRWGRFYDRHPGIDVRLTTSLNPVDFTRDPYDMAMLVRGADLSPSGLIVHDLVDVDLFPVCSPALARTIRTPRDLARQTLLHGEPRPKDWERWLEAAGVVGVDWSRGPRFESLNLALHAAIEGLGVVIAIGALVEDDLAQGRLVRPFGVARRSRRPFQLVYPAGKAMNPALVAFRDWLLDEARTSRGPRTGGRGAPGHHAVPDRPGRATGPRP
jgi:LysR family glycine cleavage system transcriptional activator